MNWISVKDNLPPKDKPFLASTTCGVEMMEWVKKVVKGESKNWYGYYCACCCCDGGCSTEFNHWMPLPKPPKENK